MSEIQFKGYAIHDKNNWSDLKPVDIKPKKWEEEDIDIAITHCGVCGSDIHTLTNGWGNLDHLPLVVGHEIVGKAVRVGSVAAQKTGFKVGDRVGVGAHIWSCGECQACKTSNENYCPKGLDTYNSPYPDGIISQGGFSTAIRANHRFVFPTPEKLKSEHAASMLCAGLTVYSPLVRNGCGPGKKVGIVGLGGLGHYGVMFAKALGAEVYMLSHSPHKEDDAKKLGADHFIVTSDKSQMEKIQYSLNLIVSTVDVTEGYPLKDFLSLLFVNGTFVNVGLPDSPLPQIGPFDIVSNGARLAGSLIGSKKEAIEMLELAAEKGIEPWVELMPMSKVKEAVEGMKEGKPKYRYILVQDFPLGSELRHYVKSQFTAPLLRVIDIMSYSLSKSDLDHYEDLISSDLRSANQISRPNSMNVIDELDDASRQLDLAMNRYSAACAGIINDYKSGSSLASGIINRALAELTKTVTYESRFEEAKSLLRRIRNQSPDLVPINTLPPEVLAHTFRFMCSPGYCCLPTNQNRRPDNRFSCPDVLLQVCYRWRQIVFATHDLWSHIDLDICHTSYLSQNLLYRALIFTVRAAQVPLHFHLRAGHSRDTDDIDLILTGFCQAIAPRIQSFNLECVNGWISRNEGQAFLDVLFSGFLPGTLTQLCIQSQRPTFLVPIDLNLPDQPSIVVSIPEQQFEELLAPVTVLNLKSVYPPWASRAYWGLTELHIGGREFRELDITDLELAGILQASPALEVFCFSLRMSPAQSRLPTLIQLSSLALFELTAQSRFCLGAILQMIHPGQIPLKMCIELNQNFDLLSPSWAEFVGFASRSNIHKLRVQAQAFTQNKLHFFPPELLFYLPQLEELALDGLVLGQRCEDLLEEYDALSILSMFQDAPHMHRLRVLDLTNCAIHWNDFRHMIEMQPTAKLVLRECEVVRTIKKIRRIRRGGSYYNWEMDLKTISPVVEISDTSARYEDPRRDGYRKSSPVPEDM